MAESALISQYEASSVVGIDVDPALLESLLARVNRAGLAGRIRGVKVEPGRLPFADASFDVVFSRDSLVQIPGKPALIADILRVLRPGAGSSQATGCAAAPAPIRRR
jgi:ubiquinone/menaquinone biosynthesis C-methylase UbiE